MSIERFKSFEAARRALWCFEPDEEYYRKVAEHFNLGRKLYPKNCPKGVFKYRSVSEADRITVTLDPDVAAVFTSSESVNKALRAVISTIAKPRIHKNAEQVAEQRG